MSSVTVIIPAYNEGAEFASSLTSLADSLAIHRAGGYEFHYLIVDDGSTDETASIAHAFAKWRSNVRVLSHGRNLGLGAALRTAFATVGTEFVIVLDADMSYSPAVAIELIEALAREKADIALASPYACGGSVVNVPFVRRLLSREANRLLSLATGGRYATLTCMVRAYRTDAVKQLEFDNNGMPAIAEMLLNAIGKRMRVVEVPATLRWSNERRSSRRGFAIGRLASQTMTTFLMACRHRPTLWLAVPGLFPGLLPLVVALLLLLRVKPSVLAIGTTATIVIQYSSLALFTGQITTFIGRKINQKQHFRSNGATNNGYDFPSRTA